MRVYSEQFRAYMLGSIHEDKEYNSGSPLREVTLERYVYPSLYLHSSYMHPVNRNTFCSLEKSIG